MIAAIIGARLHQVNDDLAAARMALDAKFPGEAKKLVKQAQARVLELMREALLAAQDGTQDLAGYLDRSTTAAQTAVAAAMNRSDRSDGVSRLVDGMAATVLPDRQGRRLSGPASSRGATLLVAAAGSLMVIALAVMAVSR